MPELDLRAVFRLLLARLHWIVLAAIAGAVVLGGYAALFVPEQYTSSAKIYVSNVDPDYDANATTGGNLSASEQLVKTIQVAALSNSSLEDAAHRLGNRVTPGGLQGAVTFVPIAETSFLQISVTNTDPAFAKEVCQVMADVTVAAFSRTGEVGVATVFDEASEAYKTSPNVARNALLGGLVGLILAVAVVVLRLFLNDTVRDKYDLRMRMDVPVLGEIPSFDLAVKGGKQ